MAFEKHDHHFIMAMGYAAYMPGIDDWSLIASLREKFSIQFLPNTSDVIRSKAHRRYIEAATNFAGAYNKEMLRLLRKARKLG